jgi:hypothetical protein
MATKTLISTITAEVFNSSGIRTDYPPETRTLTISEKNNDDYVIAPETVDQVINIVSTNCEYLAIFTDKPISIKVNGSATALNVGITNIGGHYVQVGTGINSLTVSNASTTDDANITVIVGNTI